MSVFDHALPADGDLGARNLAAQHADYNVPSLCDHRQARWLDQQRVLNAARAARWEGRRG
jgi:hypothetical protein